MLYIKDLSFFRQYYKSQVALNFDKSIDTSFINTFHPEKPGNKTKGFSYLVYGARGNIGGFLRSASLNVAADQQAIYELIQNADDCKANLFSVFYNREYLLCINNGTPFSKRNMSAILNVGDSDKDAEDIGTFGIGFKIIHRLLGEDDGLEAILNEYAGPIIYSWNQYNHLKRLLSDEEIVINKNGSRDDDCPWLLKIIYTCFPTHLGESIKNEKYSNETLFTIEEFNEFKFFLKNSLAKLNTFTENNLRQGSIFFLRIGADKFKYIDENIDNILNGIGYSFNFLNHLKRIYINEKEINKEKITVEKFEYPIGSDEYNLIRPRNEERNIDFSFSYYQNYKTALKLKEVPNIYNFFSMEEEKNGWCFLLHCNSFDMHNDRRKLQPNSNINERLLPNISNEIKQYLIDLSDTNTELFLNIYPSLLLSDIPTDKLHLKNYFYDTLISILFERIPTDKGFSDNTQDVVIKDTKLPISPKNWGVESDWFYWTDFKDDEAIIKEAQKEEKLGLDKMSISSLIEKGDVDKINEWIINADETTFTLFLMELEKDIPNENFFDLQFLKCSDNYYYSINEIVSNSHVLCLFEKIHEIKDILNELGLITTEINISDFKNIAEKASNKLPYLKTIDEKRVFDDFIKDATDGNNLTPKSKRRLFIAIKELYNVGDKSLKEWKLFSNTEMEICSLNTLISPSIKIEKWLIKYQILKSEFFEELEEYLLQADDIYPSIIYPLWEELIEVNEFDEITIGEFYSSVKNYFDEEAHKSLTLNKKAYIFTSDGFFPTSEVFYNEVFNFIMDYPSLKSSIEKVTGFKTPSKKVLTYLIDSPFKTDNDKLIDHLSDCTLEETEAYELLRFCQKAEVNIFSKGVFCESGNDIDWVCNDSKIQYYSEDSRLIEFINEYLEDTFYLIPSVLLDFKSFEGIIRNQELYEEIIEQLENINDLAVEFLPLLKHKEVIKSYLSNLSEIRIENKSSFDKSSFEYIVVSNIISHFEDADLEEIKKKIIIYDDDIEFKLEEIVTGNEIKFVIDDKIYNIKVSEILLDSDNFSKAEILDTIIANFKKLELPKTKIDKLFSVEFEEDDLSEKLAEELPGSLEDNILETAEQIAFCLLYELQAGWSKFDDFQIYASNNETYRLNEVWYAKPYSFLSEIGVIGEQYKGLSKLIKINDEKPIFKVSDSCIFLYKPAFDEDGNFVCNYIDENLDERKCTDLLNFLFEEYNKRGKESRRDFEEIDDWTKLGDIETEKIIGINPNNTILIEDDKFVMPDEVAPCWIQVWSKGETNISFLKVLGIHFYDSDIIKIRESLYDEVVSITKDEINGSDSLNAFLLENTLKWLVESEIWENKVIDEPVKVELLDAIIEKLGWELEDYWSVDIEKLNENSEEWEDEDYSKWREKDDSFEIRMYKDQMPYILEYENNILAEKNQDEYCYDDENQIFYANKNKSTQLLLQSAAEEKLFDIDTIKPLIQQGLAKVKDYEDLIEQLEAELQQYRLPKEDISRGAADSETMGAVLDETLNMVREELERDENYDCTGWNNSRFPKTLVQGVLYKHIPIKLIVRSCQRGRLHLIPKEWLLLSEPNTFLVLRLSKHKIEVIPEPLKELAESNNLFNINFDLERLTTNGVTALSKAIDSSNIKYVGVGFVIDAPRYSRSIELNEIGLYVTNLGDISSANEDEF